MYSLLSNLYRDIKLLYINIKNAFYNFFLFIYEVIKFYPNKKLREVDLEFFKLYAFNDQFSISLKESEELFGTNEEEFTYGEAVWTSFEKIMQIIKPEAGQVFYDLGCGIGRICFFTTIKYNLHSKGIELLPTFIEKANQIKNKFKIPNIEFIKEDWLTIDLSDADFIYVATTCFDDYLLNKLIKKLKSLKKGSKVISVSNRLTAENLKLIENISLPFSWGKAEVYIMEVT